MLIIAIGMRPCSDLVALAAVVSVSREAGLLLTVLVASAAAGKRSIRANEGYEGKHEQVQQKVQRPKGERRPDELRQWLSQKATE